MVLSEFKNSELPRAGWDWECYFKFYFQFCNSPLASAVLIAAAYFDCVSAACVVAATISEEIFFFCLLTSA